MKRRYFFGSAIAAGIAMRAQQRPVAPSDRVNVAIIGVGGRGRALMGDFTRAAGARVHTIVDVDQASIEKANGIAQKLGAPIPKPVGDMRRAFDDKEIDAVAVATPDHWHTPAAILACEAGKDVYVEKPPSHNIAEGRMLIDVARRTNRIVQVGTQSRSRPSTIRAIEYVQSGKIGKVLMAKAWNIQMRADIGHAPDGPVPSGVDYETWLGPAPWIPFNPNRFHYKWHWHWHFGTGDAGNDGTHQIDIARWALGAGYPKSASGWARKVYFQDDQQTPDSMNITFDYGDKALIWEMRIWNPYGDNDVENGVGIYGSEGMVHVGSWDRKWGFKVFDKNGKMVLHDVEKEGELHQKHFADCVRSRTLPNADIGIGHISAIHCHLANIVARTGRNLRFDAESETVIADAEANLYVGRKYRTHWSTPKRIA
jgi:predicted dehydrogenase